MPNASGSVDLSSLSPEEQAAVADMAEHNATVAPPEPETQDVLTLFLVVVGLDGNPEVLAVSDPRFNSLVTLTRDHIYGAASVILKDRVAEETALATAEVMQAQAQAMMRQQQEAMLQRQVEQNLKAPGGRR